MTKIKSKFEYWLFFIKHNKSSDMVEFDFDDYFNTKTEAMKWVKGRHDFIIFEYDKKRNRNRQIYSNWGRVNNNKSKWERGKPDFN